jgi:hypothetical protein
MKITLDLTPTEAAGVLAVMGEGAAGLFQDEAAARVI